MAEVVFYDMQSMINIKLQNQKESLENTSTSQRNTFARFFRSLCFALHWMPPTLAIIFTTYIAITCYVHA